MISFYQILRTLREAKGVTQLEVAKSIGITVRNYQYYECAGRDPSMSTLIALADYFDVSLDYLVGRSDNPAINR